MNGTELNMEKPEITLNGLADLTEGSFLLIDTRDEASYEYGTMENAVHFPNLYEEARAGRLPADKKLILFCDLPGEQIVRAYIEGARNLHKVFRAHGSFAGFRIRNKLRGQVCFFGKRLLRIADLLPAL